MTGFSRVTTRLSNAARKAIRGVLLLLSGVFVVERLRFVRRIRRRLLNWAGVNFSGGDFFADSGLRILFPERMHFGRNVSIGHDNCFWCFNPVSIGDWTQTAKDLLIISGSHDNASLAALTGPSQEVQIGPGCWIGARVTILGGARLGAGCIVAAGAVVKGEFPAMSIIGGVPAKVIGQRAPAEAIISPFGRYSVSELQ